VTPVVLAVVWRALLKAEHYRMTGRWRTAQWVLLRRVCQTPAGEAAQP
jgi:hypothetical protein